MKHNSKQAGLNTTRDTRLKQKAEKIFSTVWKGKSNIVFRTEEGPPEGEKSKTNKPTNS